MAKRGRPRKVIPLSEVEGYPPPKRPRGRPPTSADTVWDHALALASTISDHYAMRRDEQQLALQYALILDPQATLLELGVTHGHTAAILCYAAKLKGFTYYGIDDFSLEGSATATQENLTRLHLPFHLIEGKTQTVPWTKPIDYLLIDAGHDVVNITQDCFRFLPFVSPGGLVLFHDYNPTIDNTDPHWGVKNAAVTYCGTWETVDYIPWLLIKRKPIT